MMNKKIPKTWESTSIKEINFKKSQSIDPSNYPEETFELYSVPIFDKRRPEIIKGNEIGSTKQIVEEGDILICKINPRINRVWEVGNFSDHKKIASSEWIVVNPKGFINSTFLKYLFSAPFFRNILQSEVSGVGGSLTRARPKIVDNYKFPLPPFPEQNRIVTKLDSLFNHLDTIKARLDKIPQLIKDFRQKVLTQAVTGKLTAEWREGKALEDQCGFVTRIIESRLSDYHAECRKCQSLGIRKPITPEYLNYDLNSIKWLKELNWYEAPVGFLCDCIVPGRDKPKSFSGDIPWITTPELDSDYISKGNARYFLSQEEILEVNAKVIPENSVIISIVGKFGVSCVTRTKCVINQQLHAFLPSKLVDSGYLMYFFRTQEQLMNNLSSSTTIAYINKSKANSIIISVPPIEEQKEIVSRIETLFAKADQIEISYQKLKEKIDCLPQAILAKAFQGELVNQLPTDVDARRMMEQIKEAKDGLEKCGRTKMLDSVETARMITELDIEIETKF